MKTSLFLGTALGALLFSSVSSAATVKYKATLTGTQEVPAVTTTASGVADLDFDDVAKTLTGTITLTNLADGDVALQHIHQGALCGANSADTLDLPSPSSGVITIGDGDLAAFDTTTEANLTGGKMYINVHTQANGNGEIRGQIYLASSSETCPAADAGADGGSTSSSSSSSSSGSSGASSSTSSSSGSSSGATTERADSGASNAAPKDDSGCSTTGSSEPGNALAFAVGLGVAIAGFARSRRKKR